MPLVICIILNASFFTCCHKPQNHPALRAPLLLKEGSLWKNLLSALTTVKSYSAEKGVRLIFRYYILSIITALSGGKIKSDTFFFPLPLFSGFPPARE
jgi:hypothetical protein